MMENQMSNAPRALPAEQVSMRKKPFVLFRVIQWVVAAFFCLLALAMTIDISKLSVPGAPVALFWVAWVTVACMALFHSPPAFFRLPRIGKIGAYLAVFVALGVFGSYAGRMQEAYSKTPQGAKDAAAKAAADEKAATDKAAEDARLKAEQEAKARELADQKVAELDAQKPGICKSLVAQVIDMSKSGNGPEVIEINDIAVEPSTEATQAVRCSGSAITSRGTLDIEFSVVTTPQGKTLVSVNYP